MMNSIIILLFLFIGIPILVSLIYAVCQLWYLLYKIAYELITGIHYDYRNKK